MGLFFIIGGGASLDTISSRVICDAGFSIAINDAERIAPCADILYFADTRWWHWNHASASKFKGKIISRWAGTKHPDVPGVERVRGCSLPLSEDPAFVAGKCSGANAINLAYHMGAKTIVLLGFDGGGGNWHNNHQLPTEPDQYTRKFIPALERMAEALERRGVRVINTSMHSALTCFEKMPLDEVLAQQNNTDLIGGQYAAVG